MTDRDVFNQIRQQRSATVRKFQLLKVFGKAIKDYGIDEPQVMSCAELEDLIMFLLDGQESA